MAHYNCLIVDDEIELAKMTCEYFQMFDVSTAYVDNGEAALSFIEENDVDMVLLDINLGDASGFEVCRKIREDKQLPILFISARQSDDDVLVALSIGGDDYIKKPYNLSVLLAKVKVNLKRIENVEKEPAQEVQDIQDIQAVQEPVQNAQEPDDGYVDFFDPAPFEAILARAERDAGDDEMALRRVKFLKTGEQCASSFVENCRICI